MRETVRRLLRERHVDLVRFAYLTLDDGDTAPGVLLAQARRAVRRAAGKAGSSYAALRRALCAELLTGPPSPLLRPHRLLGEPMPGAAGPTRKALREASLHERLVCLLCRLEGLTPPETAAELGEHMMLGIDQVDRALASLGTASGEGTSGQRAELLAFDPTLVRVRPPLPPRRSVVAAGLAIFLAVGATGYLQQRDAPSGDPLVVNGSAWRRTSTPQLEQWPTRGPLSGDAALLRRAADAWRRDRREPPVGTIAVLYAGRVDGATVVVLRDSPGYRNAPMIADYYERRLSRGVESLNRSAGSAARLVMLGSTSRFLAPPWLTGVRVARPSDIAPRWLPVPVHDGLSDPVPWSWIGPRCQNYLVFTMTHRPATGGWPRPLLQLAARTAGSPTSRVWFRGDLARDVRGQWAALRAAACESVASLADTGDLRIGRLWQGGLPDGGGQAWLLTIDTSVPWGAPGTAALVGPDGRALSERGGTNGDYASDGNTRAAAVWWRSPRRWHLVAAGGPGVTELRVVGDLGTHRARGPDPLLTVPGPAVRHPEAQDVRELPVAQVVAVEPDGDRTLLGPA
ncbi:hypothetical protein [Actinomadura hibisca]|uniref:hypothetical protein n=1 Tax=Actinomadura hibisca TaxID=68565 RepID=UPI000833FA6A|nr:hypothetical protein [Actinomadura hibisca]